MGKIPAALLKEILSDPFYDYDCITGERFNEWDKDPANKLGMTRRELHHNLKFASRQISEKFCILPLRKSTHMQAENKKIKAQLDWIMLNRMTQEELTRYSKAIDYRLQLAALNNMFGKWRRIS